jgi:hypothetical protein
MHRIKFCTNALARLTFETSSIACGGTTLTTKSGRPVTPTQDRVIDRGSLQSYQNFSEEVVRAALLRYIICAIFEGRAGRSTMPPRQYKADHSEEPHISNTYDAIFGKRIVEHFKKAGWTTQQFVLHIFSYHFAPTLRALESQYGPVDRLNSHAHRSHAAGRIYRVDRQARKATLRREREIVAGAPPERWGLHSFNARSDREHTRTSPVYFVAMLIRVFVSLTGSISDQAVPIEAEVWGDIFKLLDTPCNQILGVHVDLSCLERPENKVEQSLPEHPGPRPAGTHRTASESRVASTRDDVGDTGPNQSAAGEHEQRYIALVAEKLWLDTRPPGRLSKEESEARNQLNPRYYPIVANDRRGPGGAVRYGLLELLNSLSDRFRLEEVNAALDLSRTITRKGNTLVRHPQAISDELAVRRNACREAARQAGIGEEASDDFVSYFAHTVSASYQQWLFLHKDLEAHPNVFHRYDAVAVEPTLAEVEDTLAEALLPWGIMEVELRGLIQCRHNTWDYVLEGFAGEAFPGLPNLKPTIEDLRNNSERFPPLNVKNPSPEEEQYMQQW